MSLASSRASGSGTHFPSEKRPDLQLRSWQRSLSRLRSGQEVSACFSIALRLLLISCRNSTVGDVARKVMGDVPISYIEGVGGTRVSEEDIVAVGKHDVGLL